MVKKDIQVVLAAVGVMSDELLKPAPLDEVSFCLRVDFQLKIKEQKILESLLEAEQLGLCKKVGNDWSLTENGEINVDNYLKSL